VSLVLTLYVQLGLGYGPLAAGFTMLPMSIGLVIGMPQERKLNQIPQFVTTIEGQRIHFLHARSPHPDALPLILTHRIRVLGTGVGERLEHLPDRPDLGRIDAPARLRAVRRAGR
jgi:hypothetical protein